MTAVFEEHDPSFEWIVNFLVGFLLFGPIKLLNIIRRVKKCGDKAWNSKSARRLPNGSGPSTLSLGTS